MWSLIVKGIPANGLRIFVDCGRLSSCLACARACGFSTTIALFVELAIEERAAFVKDTADVSPEATDLARVDIDMDIVSRGTSDVVSDVIEKLG
jgi:hypothetical protein